ncbi:unnamed protein product [Durusdinium trenchii]|uniref:Mitochondrial (Fertility restorer) (Protein PPR) (Restorer for CMS) n=2 Tax=Durusdinium trenchii TaxID=1381693 RepID=A0ABP0L552_9DINO
MTSSSMLLIVGEALRDVSAELLMFVLAALVYVLATRALHVPKKKAGPEPEAKAKRVVERKVGRKEMEETAEVYHSLLQSTKSNEASQVLISLEQLDASQRAALPLQLAVKVLLAVARSSEEETRSCHVPNGAFSAAVGAGCGSCGPNGNAAQEASRWRNVHCCRRLYDLAGLLSVQMSEKFLVLLVRGHSNDHPAMHSMVEQILAQGSLTLSRSFLDALTAQCTSANNQDTLKMIQVHENSLGIDLHRQARLISGYGKEGNLEAALEAFLKVKNSSTPPNSLVYNCLLDALIECKAFPRALDCFEEMRKNSLADVVSYNTIMKGHLAVNDTMAAQRVFQEMHQAGLVASRVTYHALLNAVVSKNDRRSAWRMVTEMKGKGIGASTITCSILLKSIVGRAHGQDLPKVLALMQESQVHMDEALFGGFADACARANQLELLWSVFQELVKKETPLQISGPTYGSMMKAFGQAQEVRKVKELWTQMGTQKVKLTAVTLGCMVEALVSNNHVSDAWKIVNETWAKEENQDLVNTVIYSTIVKGFTMSRQHDQVVAIYKEMKDRGIPCNTITYNTMLNALARCGRMHDVPQLLADMRDSNPPVQPDIITYSTLVKGCCIAGDVDRAFSLLEEMKKMRHVKPDEVLYNSLLDGCAKQSRVEEALKLLEEMKEQGVTPSNYTLSILCKLLGRGRRLEQAFKMVATFTEQYGFKANIQVYTCLMQACIHNRQCSRVLALHDQVVKDGTCKPDAKTYTVMLRGCLQAGLLEKAVSVVRCAYHLPGHDLCQTTGPAPGVEPACLEDLFSALSFEQREALTKDLQTIGVSCRQQATHAGTHRRRR